MMRLLGQWHNEVLLHEEERMIVSDGYSSVVDFEAEESSGEVKRL